MSAPDSAPASPAARPWLPPLAAGLAGVLLLALLLPHLFRERVPIGGQLPPTAAILPSAASEIVPTLPPGPTIAPTAATAVPEAAQGVFEGDICAAPRDDNERAVCAAQGSVVQAPQVPATRPAVAPASAAQAAPQAAPADPFAGAVELQTVEEAWAEQNGCTATSGGGRCNAQPIPAEPAGTTLTQDMLPPGWTLQEQPAETSGGGSGTISVDSLPPGARP